MRRGAGDLRSDLALARDGDLWRTTISPAWDFGTPNGGFLGALCLRAMSEALPERVPASIACTFLSSAQSGKDAHLDVDVLHTSKRTDAATVDLVQGGRRVLRSTLWTRRSGGSGGFVHDTATMPSYPRPDDVPLVPSNAIPRKAFPFYDNVEERQAPIPPHDPAQPEWIGWYRFQPTPQFNDVTLNCARALILLDALALPSAIAGHPTQFCPAATTQTDVLFCAAPEAHDTDWLLVHLRTPVSSGGMLWAHGTVWSREGRLLAQGQSKMLYFGQPKAR